MRSRQRSIRLEGVSEGFCRNKRAEWMRDEGRGVGTPRNVVEYSVPFTGLSAFFRRLSSSLGCPSRELRCWMVVVWGGNGESGKGLLLQVEGHQDTHDKLSLLPRPVTHRVNAWWGENSRSASRVDYWFLILHIPRRNPTPKTYGLRVLRRTIFNSIAFFS